MARAAAHHSTESSACRGNVFPSPSTSRTLRAPGGALLRRRLSEVAQRWARTPPVTVEVRSRGTLTQPNLGPNLPTISQEFHRALEGATWNGYRSPEVEVAAEETGLVLRVTVVSALEASASSNLAGPVGRVLSVRAVIQRHIDEKGRLAPEHDAPRFQLLYVRPPGRGDSDMKPAIFREAAGRIAGTAGTEPLWLGAAMVDWTAHGPKPHVHFVAHAASRWPEGLSAAQLENAGALAPCH